jgi:putative SOS response-associated peptidase YedK
MCGRFALTLSPRELAQQFTDLSPRITFPQFLPRYNIAPSQDVLVLEAGTEIRAALVRWGLTPPWSRPRPRELINVRSETATRGWTAALLRSSRILIPASCFYEWLTTPHGRQPLQVAASDGGLIVFAGVLGQWTDRWTGQRRRAAAILTTEPNRTIRPIHHRMPVIIPRAGWAPWLDPRAGAAQITGWLRPCPEDWLTLRPASPLVNDPRHEGPHLADPAGAR